MSRKNGNGPTYIHDIAYFVISGELLEGLLNLPPTCRIRALSIGDPERYEFVIVVEDPDAGFPPTLEGASFAQVFPEFEADYDNMIPSAKLVDWGVDSEGYGEWDIDSDEET